MRIAMVYLVGAGPGSPDLLTCCGRELLRQCDAVLYDALGTAELLQETKPSCEKIPVGKRAGRHSMAQEEINELLIATAKRVKTVVRLKGGDAFVFGRGGEEALALQDAGIPFLVVPGVTTAVAVPELLGIPLTHRAESRSFHVFTGHTASGTAPLTTYGDGEGSRVFLMGLSRIEEIAESLMAQGEAAETPAAVLSGGATPRQRRVTGTLGTIAKKARQAGAEAPAVIVVGKTAAYDFRSPDLGSLSGKKIGVVGTKRLRQKMRQYLGESGASLYTLCDMRVLVQETETLRQAFSQISQYRFIVFTSQNGVDVFFEEAKRQSVDFRRFAGVSFAVVGKGTGERLLQYGFLADYMPREYTTRALATGLAQQLCAGEKVLIPRAKKGSETLVAILEKHHIDADVAEVYDVVGEHTANWEFLDDFDAVLFASASGAACFAEKLGKEGLVAWERRRQEKKTLVGAIGPVTAQALGAHQIKADVVSEQYTAESLLKKLRQQWEVRK